MNFKIVGFQTRSLLSACCLLILVIAGEILFPIRTQIGSEPEAGGQRDNLPAVPSAHYAAPRMGDFDEILARPVFFEDRKLPPEPVDEPKLPLEPVNLKLEGVAITPKAKVAVLRNLADNQLLQLAEGMPHKGWTLSLLDNDRAVFERDGQIAELPLELATAR